MNCYIPILHIKKQKETLTWKKHSTVYAMGNQLKTLYIQQI